MEKSENGSIKSGTSKGSKHSSKSNASKQSSQRSISVGGSEGLDYQLLFEDQIEKRPLNLTPLRFQTPFPKKTLSDYTTQQMHGQKLFSQQLDSEDKSHVDESILVKCFGLRNIESLHAAINEDQRKKQLVRLRKKMVAEEVEADDKSYSTTASRLSSKFTEELSQTDSFSSTGTSNSSAQIRKLNYLLGINDAFGEEFEDVIKPEVIKDVTIEEEEPSVVRSSEAMRNAQKYLRNNKIFEFFQFIIAHMLGERPENPIDFILQILDKCLLYRSGLGHPPLLYQKRHLEQLFGLFDRMRTGFIDLEQYKNGMSTLGICCYNKFPPVNEDNMVSKEYFVEEGYDCLVDILNDMIKRRGKIVPTGSSPPPPTQIDIDSLVSSVSRYTLLPLDQISSHKAKVVQDIPSYLYKMDTEG